MATVTTLAGGATAGRTAGSVPYLVSVEIDFAAAATAKGTALAAADIIECINVPANTVALTAGIEVISALVGENADTRFSWVLLAVTWMPLLHPGTQLLLLLVTMLLLLRLSPLCSARLTPSTSKSTFPPLLRPQVLCVYGLS
jgi:hypothetical protein